MWGPCRILATAAAASDCGLTLPRLDATLERIDACPPISKTPTLLAFATFCYAAMTRRLSGKADSRPVGKPMNSRPNVPIPKLASLCGTSFANFGIEGHWQRIDLMRLWFSSPHDEFAAKMMRTSEPPH